MKKDWVIKKLDEVCEIEYGTRVVRKRDGGRIYPVYGGGGATFFMDIFNRENCLVVARFAMSEKCTRFIKGKFFLNDSGLSIKPKNIDEISQKFLNLQFLHLNDYIYALARGTAQKNLNVPVFRKLEIHFPKSLKEQNQIVEVLDKAFIAIATAKANAEQNLKNTKELFVSHLQNTFENKGDDWEEKCVGDVAKHSLGKMLDKNKNKGVPKKYLRNQSVRWFEFDLDGLTEMLFLDSEKEKYTAKKGDVLICEGGYPGRAAIWNKDYPIYFQKAIHRVRFYQLAYNEWFLYYLFLSDSNGSIKQYFTGAGIQHFTGKSLHKFRIPLPPIKAVKAFVTKFHSISAKTKKLEAIYQQKIVDLEELQKSILQKAFNGEL